MTIEFNLNNITDLTIDMGCRHPVFTFVILEFIGRN